MTQRILQFGQTSKIAAGVIAVARQPLKKLSRVGKFFEGNPQLVASLRLQMPEAFA
jgi:hypothetical protein